MCKTGGDFPILLCYLTWVGVWEGFQDDLEDGKAELWLEHWRLSMSLRTTQCRMRYARPTTWDMAVIVALAMDAESQFNGKGMVGGYGQRSCFSA
ncbi:hypothetical protein EAF00_008126 [Botryotinia globosa]|nr:hypothetical protein EAF00_008126 [Botryotinia globosa]